MSRHSFSYVALADCDCIRGAVVDDPEHRSDTADDVARWLRDGLRIERWPTPMVRTSDWTCGKDTCPYHAHEAQTELIESKDSGGEPARAG